MRPPSPNLPHPHLVGQHYPQRRGQVGEHRGVQADALAIGAVQGAVDDGVGVPGGGGGGNRAAVRLARIAQGLGPECSRTRPGDHGGARAMLQTEQRQDSLRTVRGLHTRAPRAARPGPAGRAAPGDGPGHIRVGPAPARTRSRAGRPPHPTQRPTRGKAALKIGHAGQAVPAGRPGGRAQHSPSARECSAHHPPQRPPCAASGLGRPHRR